MKTIYHIAENASFTSGGVRTVLLNLNNYLNNNSSFQSKIITNSKEPADSFTAYPTNAFWNYSLCLKEHLQDHIENIDIMHIHGVFMYTQYITGKIAKKHDVANVITPHGMLEPWHLGDKGLKKKIYLKLVLNNLVKNCNAVHAITPFEKENLYKLFKHKNIVEIPNLINYSDLNPGLTYTPEEDYLLFVGRIHPKKGLDILINAMSKIQDKNIKLKIAGSKNEYYEQLKAAVVKLNLQDRIQFLGGVYGTDKYRLFANAKALVAPSYSEAVGMVNLEAAIYKTPVITTFNTGINPEWNTNGGIMINPQTEELINAINNVTSWDDAERHQRGNAICNFVINNYSWEKKGYLWDELYNNLK